MSITLLTHSMADARPGPGPVSQWYQAALIQAACFCLTPSLRSRISAECGSVFSASVCMRECACVHARASAPGVGVCARTGASGPLRFSLQMHIRSRMSHGRHSFESGAFLKKLLKSATCKDTCPNLRAAAALRPRVAFATHSWASESCRLQVPEGR